MDSFFPVLETIGEHFIALSVHTKYTGLKYAHTCFFNLH
jgi:hypothetical protein